MFVRKVHGYGYCYIQVVESYWEPKKRYPRQRVLWTVGKYDEQIYQDAAARVRDWKRLERTAEVLKELTDSSGRPYGKAYVRRLHTYRSK